MSKFLILLPKLNCIRCIYRTRIRNPSRRCMNRSKKYAITFIFRALYYFLPLKNNFLYAQGQIHSQSLFTRNEYFTTGEGPADEDDQYLGYSVAAGDFTGDGLQDIALGVPKGLNYTGKNSF
ncbi:hypothetical protein Avbf_05741 [Armadillidium vulgare]|nr:hypothetical protein Avbf_05741 [Armadillidium vulgare]